MSMADEATARQIATNWRDVSREVAEAASAVGRSPRDVRIVGVTKYVDATAAAALYHAGCHDLAENRPQALWEKAGSGLIGGEARWHLIGHLQSNKVRRTLRHRPLIHSVDSERILAAIADEAVRQGIAVPVLLELNVSGDASKTGMAADDIRRLVGEWDRFATGTTRANPPAPEPDQQTPSDGDPAGERQGPPGVVLRGLMAMAGLESEAGEVRRQFAAVRELRDRLERETGLAMPELSIGMSGDFVEAIAEGATMIRVGTRLFQAAR